jgi:hypothetical protein
MLCAPSVWSMSADAAPVSAVQHWQGHHCLSTWASPPHQDQRRCCYAQQRSISPRWSAFLYRAAVLQFPTKALAD